MPGHSQSACSDSPESESEPSDVESTPGSASASAKAALVQAAAVARAISDAISEGSTRRGSGRGGSACASKPQRSAAHHQRCCTQLEGSPQRQSGANACGCGGGA